MDINKYLQDVGLFYHITYSSNLPNIFNIGLENKNGKGICVVRTDDENIIRYIAEFMLRNREDEFGFSILKIEQTKYNFLPSEIALDGVVELTNPLHNYIRRERINGLSQGDIIKQFEIHPVNIPDYQVLVTSIKQSGVLTLHQQYFT
jgi:hypothetical protein